MTDSSRVSAEDYAATQNLYARYNHMSDAGDAEGYAACFAEDGELSIPGLGMSIRGRDDLRTFKQRDAARRGGRIRRHWNSGLFLEAVDGNTMRGRCYLHGYDGVPGEAPALRDIGVYEDTLIRDGGEWRFAKRLITMDHSAFTPPED